jgi:myo-inositol-1(or 4)-monophosphatase
MYKKFAINLSNVAGRYLLEHFRKDSSLLFRRGFAKEVSTKYDKGSDKLIIRYVKDKFPSHNILTEESGFIDRGSEFTWIVDSLDGTSNFAIGNPFFAVSIALARNSELILGVINAPFLKEIYYAERGKGAFMNGKKIHVSKIRELGKSYVISCEGGDKTKRIAKINAKIHPRAKDMRKLGSASLEGAAVACGRAEAYIVTKIYPWDIAAAVLLVKEAGGYVTNFKGEEWNNKVSDLILSNSKIHKELLRFVK